MQVGVRIDEDASYDVSRVIGDISVSRAIGTATFSQLIHFKYSAQAIQIIKASLTVKLLTCV